MDAQVLDRGDADVLGFIKKVSQRQFKLEEAKQAKEAFMVGSSTVVCHWLLSATRASCQVEVHCARQRFTSHI